MYLVDTNIISEARRGSPQATSWLRGVDPLSVHLSTLTLGEIMREAARNAEATGGDARVVLFNQVVGTVRVLGKTER